MTNEKAILQQRIIVGGKVWRNLTNTLIDPYQQMISELRRIIKPKCRICPHEKNKTLYAYCNYEGKCLYKSARNALMRAIKANNKCANIIQRFNKIDDKLAEQMGDKIKGEKE